MKRLLLGLAILILLVGCRSASLTATATPGHSEAPNPTSVETPSSRPQATQTDQPARQPSSTPSSTPSPTPTLAPTALPTQSSDLNLLLLGADRSVGKDQSWRTDTLIIVAIRPRAGTIAMLSIPRDLWVNIPGHGQERINAVDYMGETSLGQGGGPKLLAATIKQNLGIAVDAYMRINFEGLERIIDALGGITIDSDRAMDEWFWDDTAPNGVSHMVVVKGPQHMDGHLALQYARARHGTSDFDRSRRQQQVLLAIRQAALRPEVLPRIPSLLSALADTVETNLQVNQVLPLIGLALRIKPGNYREQVFDGTMVRDWVTPDGAQVLLPNRERINQVWQQLTAP